VELRRDKTVSQIISRLEAGRGVEGTVKVAGTWGSFARLLAAHISKELGRPILYICPHIDDADKAADDLHTFGAQKIDSLPAWEGAEDLADATDEIRAERLRIALKLLSQRDSSAALGMTEKKEGKLIIPASVQALCQPIAKPEALEESSLSLQTGSARSPEEAAGWLVDNGFERVERVDLPGQFARRGGIVDIYAPLVSEKTLRSERRAVSPPNGGEAVRVEFFGDTIESIREINLDTQRSCRELEKVAIVSAVCGSAEEERELFINTLPKDCIIILEEPGDIEEVARVFIERLENTERLYDWANIYEAMEKFTRLHICRFVTSASDDFLKLDVSSVQQFQGPAGKAGKKG
jgi:transcription-repair coupling factor (superfamily II helicase)